MDTVTQVPTQSEHQDPKFLVALRHANFLGHEQLHKDLHGRLEMATALIKHGKVVFDKHGDCLVQSTDNCPIWYHVEPGYCDCDDYQKAPSNACKHRLARWLYLKTREIMQGKVPTVSRVD